MTSSNVFNVAISMSCRFVVERSNFNNSKTDSKKAREHSEKKGYQYGDSRALLLQMVPFFQRGTLFFLNNVTFGKMGVWQPD